MAPLIAQQVSAAEEQLRLAMLASDTDALARLLAVDLLFTNPLGQLVDKAADLALHRDGTLKLAAVTVSELRLHDAAPLVATSSRLQLHGSYAGSAFAADLRFTRVWRCRADGTWQLSIAHSSAIAQQA